MENQDQDKPARYVVAVTRVSYYLVMATGEDEAIDAYMNEDPVEDDCETTTMRAYLDDETT